MKYCQFCGTALEDDAKCVCPEALAYKPPMPSYVKKLIFAGIYAAVALIISFIIAIVPYFFRVDPFQFVQMTYTGYDTYGTASAYLDKAALARTLAGEQPESLAAYEEWNDLYNAYYDGVELIFDAPQDLSNGDRVQVTIKALGATQNKIKTGTVTVTVSGLQELTEVDVFSNIEVSFVGINGDGRVSLSRTSEAEVIRDCAFTIDEEEGLSTGDVVTVSVDNAASLSRTYGCKLISTSKEYTVSSLGEYLTNAKSLTAKIVRPIIDGLLEEPINYYQFGGRPEFDPEYIATYFCVAKDPEAAKVHNQLVVYIKQDHGENGEVLFTSYASATIYDVTITPDGTIPLNFGDAYISSNAFMENDLENFERDFAVTEIKVD